MAEVSIIIPVYNVEKYLSKCIESVLSQTFKDIEVICIDDGSSDGSAKILQEYARTDNRIKVFTQSNKGHFAARHNGLKQATGEYVLFVDSDDWIKSNLIEMTLNCAKQNNVDVVVFGAYSVKNNHPYKGMYSVEKISKKYKEKILTLENYERDLFCVPPTAWNKLYRKELLDNNDIKFQEIKNGEDQLFYLHTILTAKQIYILNNNLYYYEKNRPGSITSKKKKNSDAPISNFYIAEKLLNRLGLKDKFIYQVINKYFDKTLSWYSKCEEDFKPKFQENLTTFKKYIDNNFPNGWWRYFKLNPNNNYVTIKIKILLSKLKWNFVNGKYV